MLYRNYFIGMQSLCQNKVQYYKLREPCSENLWAETVEFTDGLILKSYSNTILILHTQICEHTDNKQPIRNYNSGNGTDKTLLLHAAAAAATQGQHCNAQSHQPQHGVFELTFLVNLNFLPMKQTFFSVSLSLISVSFVPIVCRIDGTSSNNHTSCKRPENCPTQERLLQELSTRAGCYSKY